MTFGDDKGWQISGFYLQLDNDHHSGIRIYPDDADAKASYASYACGLVGTKHIKG